MENHARLTQDGFKTGFLAKLASVGLSRRDIPSLFVHLAFQKSASFWNIPSEVVEGVFNNIGPALETALYKVPLALAGGAALGGGTLALATSREDARSQKILEEQQRIQRLILGAEQANMSRGISPPDSLPGGFA